MLKKIGLENYAGDFPLALSKGQRLRVILSAVLMQKPKLLLLDEPTTGQDQQSLEEIKKTFVCLRRRWRQCFLLHARC